MTFDVRLFAQASFIRITLVGIPCGGGGSDSDTPLIMDNVHEWLDVSEGEVVVVVLVVVVIMNAADTVPSPATLLHHLLIQPSSASDSSAAAAICGLTPPLHIAIDIDGFTSAARPAIFAHKYHPLTTTPHTKNSIRAVKM